MGSSIETTTEALTGEPRPGVEAILEAIRERYREIFVILSPPRCASTALARVFWNHPETRAYLHEPFDVCYHRGADVMEALAAFDQPLEFRRGARGNLILKEMTFQAREHVPTLLSLTDNPIVFLVRDPRLSIRSRMNKRIQGGQPPTFPAVESGWEDLVAQMKYCSARDIPYVVIDSSTFRNSPRVVLPALLERLGQTFYESMLSWEDRSNLGVGQLEGEQRHWYRRVLESKGIEPATETVPEISTFPKEMQAHARDCVERYRQILLDERLVKA